MLEDVVLVCGAALVLSFFATLYPAWRAARTHPQRRFVMSDVKDRAVLSCRNLGKSYEEGPQSVQVLSGVELELHPGERIAIVGSSGSGKSTLLNMLGGLDTPAPAASGWRARSCPPLTRRPVACCAIARWASSTSSTTCCPSSPRWRTSACRC